MTAFPVAKLLQRSPEDTNTLWPSPSNERERKVRGRATEEETQMGKKIAKEHGGGVTFKRSKMRCAGCVTERAEDNYVNTLTA